MDEHDNFFFNFYFYPPGLKLSINHKESSDLKVEVSGGLTINALDSRSRGPDSRRSLVIVLCSWVRHFKQTVPLPLYPGV